MTKNVLELNLTRRYLWSDFLCEKRAIINKMKHTVGEIHEKVNQRYDEMPYSYHTNMVGDLFMQYGSICFETKADMEDYGLAAIFGALFHDTIEDARLTYNDVKSYAEEFMAPNLVGADKAILAADIVYALTNEKGKNRSERENDKYFEGIMATPYAPCIKLCDRYANALYANARDTSMARKYSKEMKDFLDRITIIDYDLTKPIEAHTNIPEDLYLLLRTYPILSEKQDSIEKTHVE